MQRKTEIIVAGRVVYKQPAVGNERRAICNAKIATVKGDRRIIREYKSGEPLVGRIEK